MTAAPALRRSRRTPTVTTTEPVAGSKRWSLGWVFFVVIVISWCFVPLLRRLLDWHNGFYNPVQITSAIPYVVTLSLALFCFRPERVARMTPAFKLFAWIWFAVFMYGLIVAAFVGNGKAAAYEATQYLVPMLIGLWLAGDEIENPRLMGRLSLVMMVFGGLVALYGLAQFVDPPPWDALWIQGGGFGSMGVAEPFKIRIFSTLNSAGPAADYFTAVIILALPFFELCKRLWSVAAFVGALGAALLWLTLVRSSWIGLPHRRRGVLAHEPPPFSGDSVHCDLFVSARVLGRQFTGALGRRRQQRCGNDANQIRLATSITTVPAIARVAEIQDAVAKGLDNPVGSGLGTIGSAQRH